MYRIRSGMGNLPSRSSWELNNRPRIANSEVEIAVSRLDLSHLQRGFLSLKDMESSLKTFSPSLSGIYFDICFLFPLINFLQLQ